MSSHCSSGSASSARRRPPSPIASAAMEAGETDPSPIRAGPRAGVQVGVVTSKAPEVKDRWILGEPTEGRWIVTPGRSNLLSETMAVDNVRRASKETADVAGCTRNDV